MFLSLASGEPPTELQADVCLIGAGVMGLALTQYLLSHSRLRILLVEQGGLRDSEALSAVPAELNDGDLDSGTALSRAQGFGGSSRRWAGQALPFLPVDLSDRPFLPLRGGWPLTFAQLAPYYRMAETFLALSPLPWDSDLWRDPSLSHWFGRDRALELNVSKYSPIAYLARELQPLIARSERVTCLLDARATAIELAPGGERAEAVRVRTPAGRELRLQASTIVLCSGGIENPRLLLASRQGDRAGIGNGHDLVGRYYQDHIGYYGARLEPRDHRRFQHLFASFLRGRQKALPKIQLSEQEQIRRQLLNVTGNITIQEADDSPREAARRLYRLLSRSRGERARPADLAALLKAPFSLLPLAASVLRGRMPFPRQAAFFLIGNAESEPLWDSRIRLADQSDAAGQPRALVQWRVSDRSREALRHYFEAVRQALEGAGIARVIVSPYLRDPSLNWKELGYSLYHHMGATRMATDPRQGVVDADCRIHGVHNLYVAGTSVLPTGSASNPSFTALALTLRLAEHLAASPRP